MLARILVVDDEKSIRLTLSEFLREGGYTVETAEDAEVALQRLQDEAFDIVVSDIIMPRMTGMEFLEKSRETSPQVQVIIMTGEPTADTAATAVRAGAFDYIFKPVSREAILSSVARATAVKVLSDERDMLREQNRVYQNHLEQLVEERTRDLGESEKRYRSITESITDYIYSVRVEEGRSVEMTHSEACFAVTGHSSEEYAEDPDLWIRVVPEADRELVSQRFERILAGEEVSDLTHRVVRKDGEERWVVNSVVPHRDSEGRLLSFDGLIQDITERRRAEDELVRLSTAIEQAAEGIVITDENGTIQYVNPGFETMTGYPRGEVLGQNPRILKSGTQDAAFYRQLWETLSGGDVWSGHFTNKKKDGGLYEVESTISPVSDDSGRVTNYVAVKRDVTEQRLMDRRLHQAQKLEAIGTLAGGIAHDFNNILASVIGYSQMVQDALSPDENTHLYISNVLAAADRAKDLVRQILTFSRHDDQELQPIRIHLIVGEALKLLQPSLPSTIDIRQRINRACGAVLADPTQMYQIVMNLCTNAYHAMRDTGGVLQLELTPVVADANLMALHPGLQAGTYTRLKVSDTGHGMDSGTVERIFDPFFTTKGPEEGTGLGLANVHGIVTDCGGVIAVSSKVGEGTSFEVFLPTVDSGTDESDQPDEAPRGGSESIMIVDDDVRVLHVTELVLEQLGYDTTALTSSTVALELFGSNPSRFSMVLSDVTMPRMTGIDLARKLLQLRPGLPVILMSGSVDASTEEAAHALGIKEFLTKPVSMKEIGLRVREVLDREAEEMPSPAESERSPGIENGAPQASRAEHEGIGRLVFSVSSLFIEVDTELRVHLWNVAAERTFGILAENVVGRYLADSGIGWEWDSISKELSEWSAAADPYGLPECRYKRPGGGEGVLGLKVHPIRNDAGEPAGFFLMGADITERRARETQLAQARKLESVGRLASGMAHEINTPIQYVGDNIRFLGRAFGQLENLGAAREKVLESAISGLAENPPVSETSATADEADARRLADQIPKVIRESLEGVEQIASLVSAMKEFAQPGAHAKERLDLGAALRNTIQVTKYEWNDVADIATSFDPSLEPVLCVPAQFNQVAFDIIVNAAHAIRSAAAGDLADRGTITVQTRGDGEWAEVRIGDTGPGIPKEARDQVFDPFFTTRDVGEGRGQGLSVARDVIVEKHGGTLTFETEAGKGTTFVIRIPISGEERHAET